MLRRTADDDDPVERVVVANADQLVIVTALADPQPRQGLIDRALVAAYDAGMDPLLCLTKADLADPEPLLESYRPLGVPYVVTQRGADLREIRERLDGTHQRAARAQRSRQVDPGQRARPRRSPGGRRRQRGHRPRAGTPRPARGCSPCPGGGWIVDTPGIRSFGLAHVDPDRLIEAFPDLDDLTEDCPRGCTHGRGRARVRARRGHRAPGRPGAFVPPPAREPGGRRGLLSASPGNPGLTLCPMPSDYTDDLRLAHVLADDADSTSQARFKALDLHVMTKPDLTPVTDADHSVEEGIRRVLSRARPRDAVQGEEGGSTGHSQRRWVVDPIDGTKNFVRGVPVWASLISLDGRRRGGRRRRLRTDAEPPLVGDEGRRRVDRQVPAPRHRLPGLRRLADRGRVAVLLLAARLGRARPARGLPVAVAALLAHPGVRRLLVLHARRRGGRRHRHRARPAHPRHGGAGRDRARGGGRLHLPGRRAGPHGRAARWPPTASCTTRRWPSSARTRTTPTRTRVAPCTT